MKEATPASTPTMFPASEPSTWPEVLSALTERALGPDQRRLLAAVANPATPWEDKVARVSETPWIRRRVSSWLHSQTASQAKYPKSGMTASKLRDEGNLKFKRAATVGEALRLYSQSVVCAPELGPELALAFGNRSAALYRLDCVKECLADIELAFVHRFPK